MYLLPLDREQQRELTKSLGRQGFLGSVLEHIRTVELWAFEENDGGASLSAARELYDAVERFGMSPLNELGDYGIFEHIVALTREVEQREPHAIYGLMGRRDWLREVDVYRRVMEGTEHLLHSSQKASRELMAIRRRIAQEKFALVRDRKGS